MLYQIQNQYCYYISERYIFFSSHCFSDVCVFQEARALLGRIEYQKGNVEAALHVFEGIDIAAVTPKMKLTLARRAESNKRHSKNFASPPMSLHAVSLLLEAIFLKAKSLQHLGRYQGTSFLILTNTI